MAGSYALWNAINQPEGEACCHSINVTPAQAGVSSFGRTRCQPTLARQSVNAIETGKYDPSLPLAFRIAALFGAKIEEIFAAGV